MTVARRMAVVWLLGSCLCYAGRHPTPLDENSNCLECHADHAAGAHVHPAVKRGCLSCHVVENRKDENQEDATYVVLRPAKSIVCLECHQAAAYEQTHFPYASKMCLRCHNPHASVNPRMLRATVNELCLDCHLANLKRAPSRYLPTIELTANNSMGHPYVRHPVSGSHDPLTGGEMCCISCHLPHGGTKLHHLKMGSEIPEDALNRNTETKDMCIKCHTILWGGGSASTRKKHKTKAN
jgi:predicted CXXCH cytochrome family protein